MFLNLYQTTQLNNVEESTLLLLLFLLLLLLLPYVFIARKDVWIFTFTSISETAVEFDGFVCSICGPCLATCLAIKFTPYFISHTMLAVRAWNLPSIK